MTGRGELRGAARRELRRRIYASHEWRKVRNIVRERDGWCCSECGIPVQTSGPRRGEVAHIEPIGSAAGRGRELDANNCRLMCAKCHRQADRMPAQGLVHAVPENWRGFIGESLRRVTAGV